VPDCNSGAHSAQTLSRFIVLGRQLGVVRNVGRVRRWLTAVVLVHLVVSIVHGAAHASASVPQSLAASMFVFVVIVAGPLAGLAVTWWARRIGAWLFAATMAASFVFGVVNHFVVASPAHVAYLVPQWRPLFALTALVLAVTEALGSGLALRVARGGELDA
jgi:hypothetical protein